MRPIDADALKEELCKQYRHFSQRIAISPVFEAIKKTPSLDSFAVVHCKDCKNYKFRYSEIFDNQVPYCDFWDKTNVPENGFCFMAERRQDEQTTP